MADEADEDSRCRAETEGGESETRPMSISESDTVRAAAKPSQTDPVMFWRIRAVATAKIMPSPKRGKVGLLYGELE